MGIQSTDLLLLASGIASGILAGLLGIGGGTILVPILVAIGYTPVQAVGSSSLAILLTSISGTIQNFRMGVLKWDRILALGLPAIAMAQLGAIVATGLAPQALLAAFGVLLLTNFYWMSLRRKAENLTLVSDSRASFRADLPAQVLTGGSAGLLAGIFGVGGGVIMVPLQMMLLRETLKGAIQNSLAVIPLTAISAVTGHAIAGNVIFRAGLWVGLGGLISAQLSTRLLPKLPDHIVSILFRSLLVLIALYMFGQAWSYEP
ncbi:MAG: sulfite exporter TauE/SafE family protein [Thermosynechococcaceae cyanobacterium MS004]|nr:sulfite exporter TauE/SafE family protein [Thermosynechococcaceae cyanobacterium MS004]